MFCETNIELGRPRPKVINHFHVFLRISFRSFFSGSKDDLYNDSKNNLIKSLLKSSRSDANIREHCSRNSKFNRLIFKNCVHCNRSQNKFKKDVNPLEQLLYGNNFLLKFSRFSSFPLPFSNSNFN